MSAVANVRTVFKVGIN